MIFTARIETGRGRGRTLGSPTLNANLEDVPRQLAHGVYACTVSFDGKQFPAALFYGPRLAFGDTVSCEVHVIDTSLPSPPDSLTIDVISFLRAVKHFGSSEALQKQIQSDIENVRAILDVSHP